MNRIFIFLILLFTPVSVAAQQAFPNKAFNEKYIINKSEIENRQQSQNNAQYWLNFGPGIGTLGNGSIALIAGITYQSGKNLFKVRASRVTDVFEDGFYDFGLLYGRAASTGAFQFSFAAGLALVKGSRSTEGFGHSEPISPAIGIPIELHFNWEPLTIIGLGITGFANVNSTQSFAGITINLLIGKLR